jgi:hypothetical protein
MKRTVIVTVLVVVLTSAALLAFVGISSKNEDEMTFAVARAGNFEINVSATGELDAEN